MKYHNFGAISCQLVLLILISTYYYCVCSLQRNSFVSYKLMTTMYWKLKQKLYRKWLYSFNILWLYLKFKWKSVYIWWIFSDFILNKNFREDKLRDKVYILFMFSTFAINCLVLFHFLFIFLLFLHIYSVIKMF